MPVEIDGREVRPPSSGAFSRRGLAAALLAVACVLSLVAFRSIGGRSGSFLGKHLPALNVDREQHEQTNHSQLSRLTPNLPGSSQDPPGIPEKGSADPCILASESCVAITDEEECERGVSGEYCQWMDVLGTKPRCVKRNAEAEDLCTALDEDQCHRMERRQVCEWKAPLGHDELGYCIQAENEKGCDRATLKPLCEMRDKDCEWISAEKERRLSTFPGGHRHPPAHRPHLPQRPEEGTCRKKRREQNKDDCCKAIGPTQ